MEENSALEVGNVVDELRVLAIDAQVYSLQFLCVVLHECKYKVKTASSAAEALEILKANKDGFDVVLVDVDSVSMDGFKLLEIIGLEMYLPVIMVTEDGRLDNIRKGLMHGAVDYVLKPVRLQEINTSIWRAVTLNRTKGSEQSTHSEEDDDENQKPLLVDASCGVKKKKRMIWTPELDAKFVKAVQQLSKDSMVHPKRILKIMNEPGLTRGNIASHLQKYRDSLKKNKAGKKEHGFHVGSSSSRRISNPRKRGAKSDRLPVNQLSKFQDMNSNFSDTRMTTLSPHGGLNSTNAFQSLLCCSSDSLNLHMQNFQSFLGSDPLSETISGSACFHAGSNHGITLSEPDTALQRSTLAGASDVPNLFPGFTGLTRNISETDLASGVVENSHNDPISTDVDNIFETELKLLDDEDLISLWQLLNSD